MPAVPLQRDVPELPGPWVSDSRLDNATWPTQGRRAWRTSQAHDKWAMTGRS
jgi:hypothetical protein